MSKELLRSTLLNQYNQYKFQAHSLYLYGQIEEASTLYDLAFSTNKKISNLDKTDKEGIKRTLDICLDCLEFCVCNEYMVSSFYLNDTVEIFTKIIKDSYDEQMKMEALIAFSELVSIIKRSKNIDYDEYIDFFIKQFNILCYENSSLIKNI